MDMEYIMGEQKEKLRLYSFGNMYLGGVQAGIQCQHATTELWVKYQHESQRVDLHYKEYEYMNYVAVKMGEGVPLHEYLSSFEFELFKRIKQCRLIS